MVLMCSCVRTGQGSHSQEAARQNIPRTAFGKIGMGVSTVSMNANAMSVPNPFTCLRRGLRDRVFRARGTSKLPTCKLATRRPEEEISAGSFRGTGRTKRGEECEIDSVV